MTAPAPLELNAKTGIPKLRSRRFEADAELVAEGIPHIVWMASPDGATTYFNRQGTAYTGCAPGAKHGWAWLDLVHLDDADAAREAWTHAIATETVYTLDCRLRRFDGMFRWHSVRASPVLDEIGAVTTWIGTATEIEEYKGLELSLRRSERAARETLAVLEQIQAAAPVGFCFVDRDFRIVRINDTLARVSGGTVDELLGRTVAEVIPEVWPQIAHVYEEALSGQVVLNLDVTGPSEEHPDRAAHWLSSFYPVSVDDEIIGVGNVIVDVTTRDEDAEFRAAVMDNMAEGLCTLDGDGHLRYMNAAGAKMVGWSADELRGHPMHETVHFQDADGTLLSPEDCPVLAVRTQGAEVRVADSTFTRKDGSTFPVAYSAAPVGTGSRMNGVVVVFRDVTEELEKNARAQRALAGLSWVGRIRDALDHGHFVLYSQPIVPLRGGDASEELLLRMIGPAGNVILPGTFLPSAEKYGLVGEIDRWVITQAVHLAARGRRVGVNLSAATVGAVDSLRYIERLIRETGTDPANLVFEITETSLMKDIDIGAAFVGGLAGLGCHFALDDFGTGFGGFTYLKRLPVDELKIDIEFVRDLDTNPANVHVVRAIVSLAKAFNIATIAEGVENATTLEMLRAENVDFAQGFYLGRPEAIEILEVAPSAAR